MAGKYAGLDKLKASFATPDQRDRDRAVKEEWRRRQRKNELRYGAGWRAADEQRAQREAKNRNMPYYPKKQTYADGDLRNGNGQRVDNA